MLPAIEAKQQSFSSETMDKALLLFLSSLLLLTAIPFSSASSDSNPIAPPSAAHTELTNYGFPIGLLPADVRTYSINGTSGDFYVDFGGSCRVTLPPDNYLATYSKRIKGRIVHGRIAELDGIRVRAFFRWWSITGIRASGDNLVFEVGSVTAKYPSKNFDDTLACDGNHAAA